MTHYAKGRALPLLLLGLSLVAVSSQAQTDEKRYDCQVTTIKDRQGYVAVQAESMEVATELARNAREAATRLETREPAREVVQCVELPDGRFIDADFQSWVNQLPR